MSRMGEQYQYYDHPDSFLYMVVRRCLNEDYAEPEQRVNFNVASLIAAKKFIAPKVFARADLIADIGSSSGEFIAAAAEETGTDAYLVGIDPDSESFNYLPTMYRPRISLVKGFGEAIILPDNSLEGATAHNVIFRAHDANQFLEELKRKVKPGGFIAISTNDRGHAQARHQYEREVALQVAEESGEDFVIPNEPAHGYYLDELRALIEDVGGLEIIEDLSITQDTRSIITRERLPDFVYAIATSVNRTSLHPRLHSLWRQVTREVVEVDVEAKIKQMEEANRRQGITTEPFFADTIKRGMLFLVNKS